MPMRLPPPPPAQQPSCLQSFFEPKKMQKTKKVSQSVILMTFATATEFLVCGRREWGVVHKATRGECGTLSAAAWDAAVRLCTRAFIDERISLLGVHAPHAATTHTPIMFSRHDNYFPLCNQSAHTRTGTHTHTHTLRSPSCLPYRSIFWCSASPSSMCALRSLCANIIHAQAAVPAMALGSMCRCSVSPMPALTLRA